MNRLSVQLFYSADLAVSETTLFPLDIEFFYKGFY
jgi:hypothetical protein